MSKISIWRIVISTILLGLIIYKIPGKTMELLTFLAILVALFRDSLHSFYLPPDLMITASTNAEHFHEAEARNQQTGVFVENQAWFGVIVKNRGIGTAKNIEMIFNGIQSNRVINFGQYRSIPLRRSWVHAPIIRALHNNIEIRFDICFIRQPAPAQLNFVFLNTPNALLGINCPTVQDSTFEFEVVAISDNAPLFRKRIRINYTGNYIPGFNIIEV